jgi:DNA-nicking Smr family endonuclease
MKRLDPPPRRRRALTDDERMLWDSVAKSAKPLRKSPPRKKPDVEAKVADKAASDIPPPSTKAVSAKPVAAPAVKVKASPPPSPPLATLTRRERGRIARGKKEIDARLDLHGKTLTQAHGILKRFLTRAQADGASLVLVITGKGRTTSEGRESGALRREVPEWLSMAEFRVLVTGFEEAHIGHGGEGALYVRVRRAR